MKKPFVVALALFALIATSLSVSISVSATSGTLNVPGGSTRTVSLGWLKEGTVVTYSWSTNDNTQDLDFAFVNTEGSTWKEASGVATGSDSWTVSTADTYSMSWTYNTGWGSLATSTVTYDYSIQEPSTLSQIASSPAAMGLIIGIVILIVVVIIIVVAVMKIRSRKPKVTVGQQTAQYNYPPAQQPPQYAPPPVPPLAPPMPPQQPPYQPLPQQYAPPPVPPQYTPPQQPMAQPYQPMQQQLVPPPPTAQYPPQPIQPQYPPQQPPQYPPPN